jgi:hypothetical protein
MKATPKLFLKVYFSNRGVECTPYLVENTIYLWLDKDESDYKYLMCPETFYKYESFIKKLEKEAPLVVELK